VPAGTKKDRRGPLRRDRSVQSRRLAPSEDVIVLGDYDLGGVAFAYGVGSTTLVTTQRCLPILRSRTNPSFS
jgi:hypothetical protein